MIIDPNFLIIGKYVNAGADLAEELARDIKAGKKISERTIIALSRFKEAADTAARLLDPVLETSTKLN